MQDVSLFLLTRNTVETLTFHHYWRTLASVRAHIHHNTYRGTHHDHDQVQGDHEGVHVNLVPTHLTPVHQDDAMHMSAEM